MARVLIVEDDRNTLSGLVEILEEEGYEVLGVDNAKKALRYLERERFDILLTDLRMPDMNGLQLYEQSLAVAPETKTVIMTAYSSVKEAVDAMKRGVYEYLTKPLDLDELFVILGKAVSEQNLQRENEELKNRLLGSYRFESIIGKSASLQRVFQAIVKVSKSDATILIRGESGTGKELVARAIHYNSARAKKPLIEISCASFPETLLESELFGYERGAFTGAMSRKVGRFELSHQGTIFLDEIGEISSNVQSKLLRVLQEREITRLGGTEAIKVDVRVIAATNRDLETALNDNKFREDLYYRLNVIPIFLPPLRERKEDIPLLIDHFIRKYSAANRKQTMTISESALDICLEYDWPGNVRELENAIENAVVLADTQEIQPDDLPITLKVKRALFSSTDFFQDAGETFQEKIDMAERIVLRDAIKNAGGNKSLAAKRLDISLRTMRYKIRKYNL